jgi:gliding motility-associated-like protein
VRRSDAGNTLQVIIGVNDPDQLHTIYVVAADSKGVLQTNPVRLNATTLTCPGADAGNGGEECDLNFTFSAVAVYGTGLWTIVSGPGTAKYSPNASSPTATVTVSTYGNYTFRWTETDGPCTTFDDIAVAFYRQPQANAGSDDDICGLKYSLTANDPAIGNGRWAMTSGTGSASFQPDANTPDATVEVTAYGTKVFTWTVTNGTCSSSSNVTIRFYMQPVADAGEGGSTCSLDFYLGAKPSSGNGVWSKVSGPGSVSFIPNTGTPNPKVTVSVYGSYVFRWTETNSLCSSSATVNVNFGGELSANAGNGGDECDRDFKLNAVPAGGTGTWSKVSGPGNASFSPDAHHPDALVTVSQYGEYNFAWTEVRDNCSSTDIIRVGFHSPPAVSAGPDLDICRGNSVQLTASGSGSFVWSPGNILDNPLIYNPIAYPVNSVTLTVTLTDNWGCRNSDKVAVDVKDLPLAFAGSDQTLDYVFLTGLDASNPETGETGEWSVLTGTGIFDDKNNPVTEVSGLSLGINSMLWSVSNGACPEVSDTVTITINDLIVPSLITPNMDGKNDYFILKGLQSLEKTSLRIFNRWGESVFSNDNYDNKWDGKDDDGKFLPDDTYFYILKSRNRKPISGYVVIRR